MTLLVASLALLQALTGMGAQPQPSKTSTSAVIAVIVPDAATSSIVDALNRLRGEAVSVGFEIRLVKPLTGATTQAKLERVAHDLSPAAVVALSSDRQVLEDKQAIRAIDIWFLDRTSGRTSVGHLPFYENVGARVDQALAVGVVDFIRARMFDSMVQASVESKAERPSPVPPIRLGRFQVLVGLGAVAGTHGLSTAWLPTLESSLALRPWLRLSVAGGGFGTQVQRRTTAGSVDIEQRLLKTSATFLAPALARRWYLYAETGFSLLFVATRGKGNSGYTGQAPTGWSPGVHCQGGVALALTAHVVLQTSLGTLWLWREQQVFIADDQVARTGRPTWLGSMMVGVVF